MCCEVWGRVGDVLGTCWGRVGDVLGTCRKVWQRVRSVGKCGDVERRKDRKERGRLGKREGGQEREREDRSVCVCVCDLGERGLLPVDRDHDFVEHLRRRPPGPARPITLPVEHAKPAKQSKQKS
eukprot:3941760-Rhodomonas_salina.1